MDAITTALELVGALAVIGGLAVVVAPLIGIGWAVVAVGVALVVLSWFIEHRRRPRRAIGGDVA